MKHRMTVLGRKGHGWNAHTIEPTVDDPAHEIFGGRAPLMPLAPGAHKTPFVRASGFGEQPGHLCPHRRGHQLTLMSFRRHLLKRRHVWRCVPEPSFKFAGAGFHRNA